MKSAAIHGVLLTAFAMLTGCAYIQPPAPPLPKKEQKKEPAAADKPEPKASWWDDSGASGAKSIVIHLSEQRACFYMGEKLVGESRISTGRKGFETPPGSYTVIQKDKAHVSNLYGDFVNAEGGVVKKNVDISKMQPPEGATFRGAKMRYFLRFTGGYGMHAGYVPSYRASHGCIRMPGAMAEHFFQAADYGTPVTVKE